VSIPPLYGQSFWRRSAFFHPLIAFFGFRVAPSRAAPRLFGQFLHCCPSTPSLISACFFIPTNDYIEPTCELNVHARQPSFFLSGKGPISPYPLSIVAWRRCSGVSLREDFLSDPRYCVGHTRVFPRFSLCLSSRPGPKPRKRGSFLPDSKYFFGCILSEAKKLPVARGSPQKAFGRAKPRKRRPSHGTQSSSRKRSWRNSSGRREPYSLDFSLFSFLLPKDSLETKRRGECSFRKVVLVRQRKYETGPPWLPRIDLLPPAKRGALPTGLSFESDPLCFY